MRSVVARKSKYFARIYFLRTWKYKIVGNNLARVADLIGAGITIGGLVCKYAGYAHVLSVPSWAAGRNINSAVNYQGQSYQPSKLGVLTLEAGVPAYKLGVLTARSRCAGVQTGRADSSKQVCRHAR